MEFSEARENENVFLGKYDINEEIKRLKNAQPRENLGKIASESVKKATEILQKYKLGKANLEARIIDNEEWYRLQHWKKERYEKNKSSYESLYTSKGFEIAYNRAGLNINSQRVLGLFPGIANREDPRIPSLEELTVFALDYLDNEEGFFLMVEGANIDKQSHSHQTRLMLRELLGFNEAVKAAQDWAAGRDDTVILVTADHETGGLYYDRNTATKDSIATDIKWLTYNHSRTRVDIAIYGNITPFLNLYSDEFDTLEGLPYWDNTDVFRFCSWHLHN